jgi:hypothetical protein
MKGNEMAKANINPEVYDRTGNRAWEIRIIGGYEIKDALKENGYNFDSKNKVWYKSFLGKPSDNGFEKVSKEYKFLEPLIDGDVMGKGTFMAFGIHHQ